MSDHKIHKYIIQNNKDDNINFRKEWNQNKIDKLSRKTKTDLIIDILFLAYMLHQIFMYSNKAILAAG